MDWLSRVFGRYRDGAVAIRRVTYDGSLKGFWCIDGYFNIHQVGINDLKSLKKIVNLEVTMDGMKGTMHSIDRIYCVDDLTGAVSGNGLTVLHMKESKVDGNREYTVVDGFGRVEEVSELALLKLTEKYGGVNYKLVERDGKKFVAPISQWYSKELLETKIWNKEAVLRLKDTMGKMPLDKGVYVYKIAGKKSVERTKMLFKYTLPRVGSRGWNLMIEQVYPELRANVIGKSFYVKDLVENMKVHPRTAKHYEKSVEAFKNGYVNTKEMDNRILIDFLNYSVLNVANPKNKVKEAKKLIEAHASIAKSKDKKAATYLTGMYADYIQLKRHAGDKVGNVYPYIHRGLVKRMEIILNSCDVHPIYSSLHLEVSE